jgi:hypothetical protein
VRSLFPLAPTSSITRRKVLFATLAVIAGTLLSLGRTTGAGALNTIMIEDGPLFLSDAVSKGFWSSVTESYSGYYHLVPRLLAQFNALFPADWAAPLFAIEAALVTSLLALMVYTASAGIFNNTISRVLVSAPMILMPLAQDDLYNCVATLRWQLMYAVFWAVLWVSPSRIGRIIGPLVVFLAAFSDNAVWVFVPLVLLRLWARRDRGALLHLVFLVAGALASAITVLSGVTNRGTEPRIDPIWAAQAYFLRPVPQLIVGVRWATLRPGHTLTGLLPVAVAWAAFAVIVFLAWRKVTKPHWPLAIVAMASSVALYFFCTMAVGQAVARYSAPTALLVLTALVALMQPPRRWPLYVFTAFFAVVIAFNYRMDGGRTDGPLWSDELAKARVACAQPGTSYASLQVSPIYVYWGASLPCTYLRK